MKLFTPVLNSYREWILSFPILRSIQPFALYIMCIGLGVNLFITLLHTIFTFYFMPLNIINTLAGFAFYIGLLLLLTGNEIKLAPYGMFAKAFVILFPFFYINLNSLLSAAVYLFLGYQLLNYLNKEYEPVSTPLPFVQPDQTTSTSESVS